MSAAKLGEGEGEDTECKQTHRLTGHNVLQHDVHVGDEASPLPGHLSLEEEILLASTFVIGGQRFSVCRVRGMIEVGSLGKWRMGDGRWEMGDDVFGRSWLLSSQKLVCL